jgi:tetratricopeptide (TPR) repeat protein
MNESGGAPPPSSQEEAVDRLDSWKEIAAYLNRDVSTVQRWEKREQMPVHRHLHDKLGSVYAFRSELDGWWRGRGPRLTGPEPGVGIHEPVSASQSEKPSTLDVEGGSPRTWRWSHTAATAAAIVVVGSLGALWRIGPDRETDGAAAPTSADPAHVARPVNPEAHDLLLRARYLSVRTTNEDNARAIELLEQAIAIDPNFAPAYGELSSAYVTRLAYVTPDESRELEQKAFSTAHKALTIDPNTPEGYLGRGDLLWTRSHRFAHESAVEQFRHALSLKPDSDEIHRRLARVFVHIGFFDEAIQHADTALKLNPSNAQALNSRAQALLWMGKDEEALAILSTVPGPVLPELVDANLVFARVRLNRRDEASSYLQRAKQKYSTDLGGTLTGMEAVLLADSDPAAAQKLVEGLSQRKATNTSHHSAYFAAIASARMRRVEQAVEWLREAADTGFPCYALFVRDPTLDPIRQEPQFRQFMTELEKRSAALRKAMFES